MSEAGSLDDTARAAALRRQAASAWRPWVHRLTEPHRLFPVVTLLILAVIWSAATNLVRIERSNAEATSAAATLELVNTYEAQVVRALREIDQTLKLIQFEFESKGSPTLLQDLKARTLLPPDLIFAIRLIDRDGAVTQTTRAVEQRTSYEDRADLAAISRSDALWVDVPRKLAGSQEWTLQFGRRLVAKDGSPAGAVLLAVDASYFVSGYEVTQLGKQGTLGLLGTDGIFRARRTGDGFSAGDFTDYATTIPNPDQADPTVVLTNNHWDGLRRFTGTRQLFNFPLAVIVGLSQTEQLAAARDNARRYLQRAAGGSAVLVLVMTLLGRMSWQLARSRERESEANVRHAQRVEYLAYHDALTALPNRSLFNKLLSQALRQAERHQRRLAVAFIDLDRFKQINDTLGHEAGDQLLQQVASRLKTCLRDSDTVARLGGDEFVVLLPELEQELDVTPVAQKMIATIAQPFILLGQEYRVTASVGISLYPEDALDEQTLTKNADIAMYQAKEAGKNNFQFYSDKLNATARERLRLESSRRHAMDRNDDSAGHARAGVGS